MCRLTYKELMSGYYPKEDILDTECFDKLGKLEDIEEKIGCPIDVIFKAIKQKYIFVNKAYCCPEGKTYDLKDKKLVKATVDLSLEFTAVDEINEYFKHFANRWCFQFRYDVDYYNFSCFLVRLSDYRQTWWLKEDKTE